MRVVRHVASATLAIVGLSLMVIGCAATTTPPSPDSVQHLKGEYRAILTGNRKVQLVIHDDLTYDYVEDSPRGGRIIKVRRNGQLRFKSKRLALAGRVQLKWQTRYTIRVWSPYASTIGHGNNDEFVDGRGGVFLRAGGGHVFYLNRFRSQTE